MREEAIRKIDFLNQKIWDSQDEFVMEIKKELKSALTK